MKKSLFYIIGVIVLVALVVLVFLLRNGVDTGTVTTFNECVSAGHEVRESYPRQCVTPAGEMFTEDIGNELEKRDLIQIFTPRPNQTVESPLTVTGEARGTWYFEASFPVRLLDAGGNELAVVPAQAQGEWMTEDFVPFSATLTFSPPAAGEEGVLVLEKDNPSGLPQHADELRIPVRFEGGQQETTRLQVHFGAEQSGAGTQFDCTYTVAVERVVPRTQALARTALEQLLAGPTSQERDGGLFTSLPEEGVMVQSIRIEDGTAFVDFNEALDHNVGGSCRVAGIHSQITNTLTQFSTVDRVVVSINGRTEDILQP